MNNQIQQDSKHEDLKPAFDRLRNLTSKKVHALKLAFFSILKVRFYMALRNDRAKVDILRRISKLNHVLHRYSDKSLSQPSIPLRRAFFRWYVKINSSMARECLEKMVLTVTIKKEISVWRLMKLRDAEFIRRKAKFLEFVEKLVDLTSRANDKMVHSYKNLFFFSLLLISARKEREEFNRRLYGFVKTVNGKLQQKASSFANRVVFQNPKKTLFNILEKSTHKKEQESFNQMLLLAKKGRLVNTYKFVDLFNSKMANKAKHLMSNSVCMRKKLVNIIVNKLQLSLKRHVKQLINRSLILLNQKEGLAKFVRIIELSGQKLNLRTSFRLIELLGKARMRAEKLKVQMELIFECRQRSLLRIALRDLKNKVSLLKDHKKKSIVKSQVRFFKIKTRTAFDRLRKYSQKVNLLMNHICRKLENTHNERLFDAFGILKILNFGQKISSAKEKTITKSFLSFHRLANTNRTKRRTALNALRFFNKAMFQKMKTLLDVVERNRLKQFTKCFMLIRQFADTKQTRANLLNKYIPLLDNRLVNYMFRNIQTSFKKLQDYTLRSKNGLAILSNLTRQSIKRRQQEFFQLMKIAILTKDIDLIHTSKLDVIKEFLVRRLVALSNRSVKNTFQSLQSFKNKKINAESFLIKCLKRKSFLNVKIAFGVLQRNKTLSNVLSDQEKHRLMLVRMLQALYRFETKRKSDFIKFLQRANQKAVLGRQLVKKLAENKYKQLISVCYSKLINHCRKNKLFEYSTILDKTTTDLSDFNKVFIPKYNKNIVRNLFHGQVIPRHNLELSKAFKRLRMIINRRSKAIEVIILRGTLKAKYAMVKCFKNLKEHSETRQRHVFETNLTLWSLNKMVDAKNNLQMMKSFQSIRLFKILRQRFENALNNIFKTQKKSDLHSAMNTLLAHAMCDRLTNDFTKKAKKTSDFVQIIGSLYNKKVFNQKKAFMNQMGAILNQDKQLRRCLVILSKMVLRSSFQHLLRNTTSHHVLLQENKLRTVTKNHCVNRIVDCSNAKQQQAIKTMLKVLNDLIKSKDKSSLWVNLCAHLKSSILKDLIKFARAHNNNQVRRDKIKLSLGRIILNARMNRIQSLTKLRLFNSKRSQTMQKLLLVLKESNHEKLSLAFETFKSVISEARDRSLRVEKFIIATTSILRFKIIQLQKRFFARMADIKHTSITAKLTESTLSKMNFRKKAGEFLDKLAENQTQSKLKLKQFAKLANISNGKLLQTLMLLCKMNQEANARQSELVRALCLPLVGKQKSKLHSIFGKLRRRQADMSLLLVYLNYITTASRIKQQYCWQTIRNKYMARSNQLKKAQKTLGERLKLTYFSETKHFFALLRSLFNKNQAEKKHIMALKIVSAMIKKQNNALKRLINPTYRKNTKIAATDKLIAILGGIFGNRQRSFFNIISKFSPLFMFKMWKRNFSNLHQICLKRTLLPFLIIQRRSLAKRGARFYKGLENLVGARTIMQFIKRRNLNDENELLHPCLLMLIANAFPDKLDIVDQKALGKFGQLVQGPFSSIDAENLKQIIKKDDLRYLNLQIKETKDGLVIGNALAYEQTKSLLKQNEMLESEREHALKNHQDLEQLLIEYQTNLNNAKANLELQAAEIQEYQRKKEALEQEKKGIEQNTLFKSFNIGEELFSPRNTFTSYEAGQEFKHRITKLQKEKKDLELLLSRYVDETKNMEDEMNRFEKEEFSFIEKIATLQGDHLTAQQQLMENESIQKKLRDENRQLRIDNNAIIDKIEDLTKETKIITDQLKAMEEEGKKVAMRELVLKEENTGLVKLNQNLLDENAFLLQTQENLLKEKEELLEKNKELSQKEVDLTNQRENLIKEKEVLQDTEQQLRRQIFARRHSKSRLMQDNEFLLSQRSLQLDDQEALLKEVNNPKGTRKKSVVANEKLGSIFLKLKVIDENINQNNQQINSEEQEIQKAEGELRETTNHISNADWQIKQLDARIDQVQNILSENILKVDALTERINLSSNKILKNNNQIEINGKLINDNRNLMNEIEQTLRELREQEEEGTVQMKSRKNEIQKLNSKFELNSSTILDHQKNESKLMNSQAEIEKRLHISENRIREFENKKHELAQKIFSLEKESQNIFERDQITKSLISEKGVGLVSIAEYIDEDTIPLDISNLESRQDITRRMVELRENLENVSKTLEEKKALLNKSERQYSKTQVKIDDKKKIIFQNAEKISLIQQQIDKNQQNINEQSKIIKEKEAEINKKDEQLKKNREEIKLLNDQLMEVTHKSILDTSTFKKMLSKKVQTFAEETSESRTQTEICFFDISNLEKRAAQKHIVKTIEQPIKAKTFEKGVDAKIELNVAPAIKETPKAILVEESIAPIIYRVRQMQREPSMRKDLPLAVPDDPMNLPFLKQDTRLDRIDKLYDFKFETAEENRDIIGILKKNPFMKIELYFDFNNPEKKTKAKKNVECMSSYYIKNTESHIRPPVQQKDMDMYTEAPSWDIGEKIGNGSLDLNTERFRGDTTEILGTYFAQHKSKQTFSELQDIYEFIFPKVETKALNKLPSIKEFVPIDNAMKEVQTNATQTEFEASSLYSIQILMNIFKNRDLQNLYIAFRELSVLNRVPVKPRPDYQISSKRIFNNKKVQIQYQLKNLKQKKNDNVSQIEQVLRSIFKRHINDQYHHFKLIINLDMCKLYLNSLFRWKLQNAEYNHKRKLDHIKSLRMGLDSIFTHLIFKRLSYGFRQIQRHQDLKLKNVYSKLLPIIFKYDQSYKNAMRNVLRYWCQIKDENRWYTKIIRELISKASLEPQLALWRLKIYRRPVKVIPPKVLAGITRLCRFFKAKGEKLIKEVSTELVKFILIPSEDSVVSEQEVVGSFSEKDESSCEESDENLSRANAKYLVLSVKSIFRTLEDRWNVRKCAAFVLLRNFKPIKASLSSVDNSVPPKESSEKINNHTQFLIDQNFKCKQELERKDSAINDLNTKLSNSKNDLLFLKNSFLYVVLNRIQYVINKHRKEAAVEQKRAFIKLLKTYY